MRTYAAHIEDGVVTEVIVATAEWASENLGGVWVYSPVKVGVGWQVIDGEIISPEPDPDSDPDLLG